MFTEFEAKNHTYKLRLTTQGAVQLEKALGYNPLQMFMGIDEDILPKLGEMALVIHRMLQPYNHGITLDDTYEILDDFFEDGHTIWDLVPVIIEAFKEAGFLPKEEDDEPKN